MTGLQTVVHYSLHLLLPIIVAWLFFRKKWKTASLLMLMTLIIDIDHLLADPVFDPMRCSIGFHPLHSFPATGIYFAALAFKDLRMIAAGLLIHIFTDLVDCIWIFSHCGICYEESEIIRLVVFFEKIF